MQKVKIITHGGEQHLVKLEKYDIEDAVKLNAELNSNDVMTVRIGPLIFSKIDIKQVIPVEEEPPVTEPEQLTTKEPGETVVNSIGSGGSVVKSSTSGGTVTSTNTNESAEQQ